MILSLDRGKGRNSLSVENRIRRLTVGLVSAGLQVMSKCLISVPETVKMRRWSLGQERNMEAKDSARYKSFALRI